MSYSHMGKPHTTIGAEHFHFRVRNGIGWFLLAMAARRNFFGWGQTPVEQLNCDSTTSGIRGLTPNPKKVTIWKCFDVVELSDFNCWRALNMKHSRCLSVIWSSLTGN